MPKADETKTGASLDGEDDKNTGQGREVVKIIEGLDFSLDDTDNRKIKLEERRRGGVE